MQAFILRADATGSSDEDWQRLLNVNVNGVFFMSRAAVREMVGQGGGAIVNFGSIWGDVGSAGVVAYCASKGAVHQITRSMAMDHADDGIRINAVAPGEVNTPMLAFGRPSPPSAADLQQLADETIPVRQARGSRRGSQRGCLPGFRCGELHDRCDRISRWWLHCALNVTPGAAPAILLPN